jgi:DNA-binding MarR family transcriptional regulator
VQWDALRHLARNPDASLHDLARLTFQSDQAFGALAGRMVERGLIERVAGPGRAVHHRITPRGRRLLAEASPLVDEVLAASLGALTAPQLDVLGDLLERLVGSVDPPG